MNYFWVIDISIKTVLYRKYCEEGEHLNYITLQNTLNFEETFQLLKLYPVHVWSYLFTSFKLSTLNYHCIKVGIKKIQMSILNNLKL